MYMLTVDKQLATYTYTICTYEYIITPGRRIGRVSSRTWARRPTGTTRRPSRKLLPPASSTTHRWSSRDPRPRPQKFSNLVFLIELALPKASPARVLHYSLYSVEPKRGVVNLQYSFRYFHVHT